MDARPLLAGFLLLVAAGCSTAPDEPPLPRPAAPVPSVPAVTAPPGPLPAPLPSGHVLAEVRQSSLDAAAGQAQVWLDNGTSLDLVPTRILYADPRLPRRLSAARLRSMPAGAGRGFPLALPGRPRCAVRAPEGSGTVVVHTTDGSTYSTAVDDETDVIGRYVEARCDELRLRRVVALSWSPDVDDGASTEGGVGRLVLRLDPTGADGRVVIRSVGGSHLLGSADGSPWAPDLVVRGTDRPTRLTLPLRPARCDVHAFMEGGNATAFRVGYAVDGRPGSLLLRMDAAGAANAIRFARESCGLS